MSQHRTVWSAPRLEVVETCRRAAAEGLVVGTAGNVSLGVGDHVAITATGADFATLEEQHVVVVDRSGHPVVGDLEPTSELDLHLGIHAAHEGDVAVVHTHAPVGVAVGLVTERSLADAASSIPFAELRSKCRIRTSTLYERLAALTTTGRIVKASDGGYRLVG